jgi:hypothetical protein
MSAPRNLVRLAVSAPGVIRVYAPSGRAYEVTDRAIDVATRDAETLLTGNHADLFEIVGFHHLH